MKLSFNQGFLQLYAPSNYFCKHHHPETSDKSEQIIKMDTSSQNDPQFRDSAGASSTSSQIVGKKTQK